MILYCKRLTYKNSVTVFGLFVFSLVVVCEPHPLLQHQAADCLNWSVLVFGFILGCLLVV
jgi:hypothetical protein